MTLGRTNCGSGTPIRLVVWRLGAALQLAATVLTVGALLFHAMRTNHVGYEIRWLFIMAICIGLYGVSGLLSASNRRWGCALCIAAFMLVALLFCLDHYNLLVEYEVWVQRGMPDAWGAAQPRG
jgi:hypothetical protein